MFHSNRIKMKNMNKYSLSAVLLVALTLITACSDDFLTAKQDYSRVTAAIYNDYAGAKGRINDIYSLCSPRSNTEVSYDNPSTGTADLYATCTEEYGGFVLSDGTTNNFVSDNVITNNTVVDFFYSEAKTSRSPWGRIRNCNDAIEGIEGGTLSDAQKKELLGQAYFFRAWTYYRLVKTYGGVPIVDHVQNPEVGGTGGLDLAIPRSTTKQCLDFLCNDLEKAASYLPLKWDDGNWGRVTAGAALALEGRARLLYASPLFNRADDNARWKIAYDVNKRAVDSLNASGFYGLAYLSNPGINASGWAKMFSDYQSPEAVFVTLYNNLAPATNGTAPNFNNTWENSIRPINSGGGGGKSTTAEMVDLFPMSNGLPATDKDKNAINSYDKDVFFVNRDPRFYRTFAFPGVQWTFNGTPKKSVCPYTPGSKYQLWNYAWYETTTYQGDETYSGYGADKLATNYKGIYIRKKTDDFSVNSATLYVYDSLTSTPFQRSAAPFIEMRYAEVLLNFAEAACGANHGAEALTALRLIRQRVGYTGTCGLDDALAGNRAGLFAAILYERQVELAYEGKRFDDMRRWMLWDGGDGQAALKSTWALTGFGGNTCTYLGVKPLNGQRRTGMELRVSSSVTGGGIAPVGAANDPIVTNNIKRPQAWNISESNAVTSKIQQDSVAEFYRYNLTRKQRMVDTKNKVITFRPEYYIIGLKSSAQVNNTTLLQTIGWTDGQQGGMGTFDPLAE
jgi:starch-binding outer membrane protein, SusD/RagB family